MAEFPWYKSYPDFVPKTIDASIYTSIPDLVNKSVQKYSNAVAFQNMDKTLTFAEIGAMSDAFAWYCQHELKLKKGDRIAIQMPNLMQFPIACFGALKAGLIVVNTNPLYTPEEMQHQFKDAGAKAIVILENFACNLEKIITQTDIEHVIVTRIGDCLGGLKGGIVNLVVKHVKKMVPAFNLPQASAFKDCLNKAHGKKPDPVELKYEDTAFLQYTGGTTGVSKGAELTHGNICSNSIQANAYIGGLFENGKDTIVSPLPLYHIFALLVSIKFFESGNRNILITNPKDLKAYLKDLIKNEFHVLTGVNTLFNAMVNHSDIDKVDFSHMKIALGGGMAVQDAVAKKWEAKTGKPLLEAYGLSETSPAATINPVDGTHRMGTIGLPIPSTDIRIFDEEGKEVEVGKPGEIGIKGPQVMKGYWNRPDETEKCFLGDYFLTGDIGIMDEDGFFRIVDRKKEMINVSGFNVYPNDIEKVIAEHPKVLEVGVRGEEVKPGKEIVKAFIVKKDESLTADEVKAFCKEKLTNYKVPKDVVFRDELPKSNVGKILRRLLE
jgi:long-chain acyl-CoA synthetase